MNDDLLKLIQNWTNTVPLIILGSGASVPFNLPSMWSLGEHLKNTINFLDSEDQTQFDQFKAYFDADGDLESTLTKLHLREKVLSEIVNQTWAFLNESDLQAYEQILNEEIDFPLVELLQFFLNTAKKQTSIITTNYDRLAEYAASLARAFVCTGYSQNPIGHFSNNIQNNNLASLHGFNGQVNIWKVHGSLDWFRSFRGENIQLPLRRDLPKDHQPLIVTPGLSKYAETHTEPYRTILAQTDVEIEKAVGFLCIGYGFNDAHVQEKLIAQIRSGKPIIVLTKQLTPKTKQLIIDLRCPKYLLMEEANEKDTRVYSSNFIGEQIIPDVNYWSLVEYLKLIK